MEAGKDEWPTGSSTVEIEGLSVGLKQRRQELLRVHPATFVLVRVKLWKQNHYEYYGIRNLP